MEENVNLSQPQPQQPQQSQQPQQFQQIPVPPKKKSGCGCWITGCLAVIIAIILFASGIFGLAVFATQGPVKVVKEQLVLLREKNIDGAYALTSVDFKEVTDLNAFRKYINSHPIFTQNTDSTFTSRKVENNKGYIEGVLTATDGTGIPISYMLIKEKGIWRVYNMELAPSGITESSNIAAEPKPVAKSTETAIEKVEVGTQRAADGKMLDARERFLSSTAEIKVSVYISGALKGQNVSAIWFYEGEQISQPIVNIIEEDGNFISQFKVSQPQNGWPMGKYKVVIMIDEGKKAKEVEYSIESV